MTFKPGVKLDPTMVKDRRKSKVRDPKIRTQKTRRVPGKKLVR